MIARIARLSEEIVNDRSACLSQTHQPLPFSSPFMWDLGNRCRHCPAKPKNHHDERETSGCWVLRWPVSWGSFQDRVYRSYMRIPPGPGMTVGRISGTNTASSP